LVWCTQWEYSVFLHTNDYEAVWQSSSVK
jgi:hypothetical protein